MLKTYDDLHQVVSSALETYTQANKELSFRFAIAENHSCSILNEGNNQKMVFMLAKFAEEYKVGFAFFESGEIQPDWMDDIYANDFNATFVKNLIEGNLL